MQTTGNIWHECGKETGVDVGHKVGSGDQRLGEVTNKENLPKYILYTQMICNTFFWFKNIQN